MSSPYQTVSCDSPRHSLSFNPPQPYNPSKFRLTNHEIQSNPCRSTSIGIRSSFRWQANATYLGALKIFARYVKRTGSQHPAWARHTLGIFWRSRLLVLSCFIPRLSASLGNRMFHYHFDGIIVGSTDEQERNIRSVCFLLSQFLEATNHCSQILISLCADCQDLPQSSYLACIWWLWRRLTETYIPLRVLDAADHTENSIMALLDLRIISKLKLGALLVLVNWEVHTLQLHDFKHKISPFVNYILTPYRYLQIPRLVTSSILFGVMKFNTSHVDAPVATRDTASYSRSHTFASSQTQTWK